MGIWKARKAAGVLASVFLAVGAARAEWAGLHPANQSGPAEAYRLNCGAENFDFTDGGGNWWMKDESFTSLYRWGFMSGQAGGQTAADIQGTTDDAIYQTHHFGPAGMAYRFEVPNGRYTVKLHFAETYWTQAGQRVFDVQVENQLVQNVDIVARAPGQNRAYVLTFTADVTDEALDVSFPRVVADMAMISGIEAQVVSVSDDNFLGFIERKLFWLFWNETNPLTGLVSDRVDNWRPQTGGAASIASTGFGLSALTIAAQRGWVPANQALQRIKNTLATFAGSSYAQPGQTVFLPNLQGFWYHWVDRNTGARAWDSEVSTVDSAIFLMGALEAKEYFKTDATVVAMVNAIQNRMNWTWWLNRVPAGQGDPAWEGQFVTMAWVPEVRNDSYYYAADPSIGGSFTRARWNGYSESVFVNLLAMGAPVNAISTAAWTNMGRSWVDQYGYTNIHQGPLFEHQYHHLYYDLANKHDAFVDYGETTRRATLANKNYCQTVPGYAADRWGVTSADNPATDQYRFDYGVPPGASGDGTVAPTAALASVVFTPTESIRAARHMYFQYKHDIWGRYGFTDSFNVNAQARSASVLSLDNGAMLLAIENYRSGLIRNTFARTATATLGLSRTGFSAYDGKPYYPASSYIAGNLPAYAFDGNPATRWESEWSDNQWLAVDYTTPRLVNRARLTWEAAHPAQERIEYSADGNTWTAASATVNSDGGDDTITFPAVRARFFRVKGLARATPWGNSLFECVFDYDANLQQSTYFGGSGNSVVNDVVTDASGNVYVAGMTANGHPTTPGAYDVSYNGGLYDAFIAKFSPTGQLIYSTLLGGAGEDQAAALAVDAQGIVTVTGLTYSANFPTTANGVDRTLGGERDAFVARLSATGGALLYSTYLGGSSWDYGQQIALGPTGDIFMAGFTHGDFPTTPGAAQTAFGGYGDAYVVHLSTGGALLYSTYLGGQSWDGPGGIVVDGQGNAFVAGNTHSINFPTTVGAYDRVCNNCSTNYSTDGFVAKISPTGTGLVFSTLLGGAAAPSSEGLNGVALDAQGRVAVVGISNAADFPTTSNAYRRTASGGYDVVAALLSADGSQLLYGTYLGGAGNDRAMDMVADPQGRIYVSGFTDSTNFPTTADALQTARAGGVDLFLAKIGPNDGLMYSTYLGGTGNESPVAALAADGFGRLRLAGATASSNFPMTVNAPQPLLAGGTDGVLATFASLYPLPGGGGAPARGAPPADAEFRLGDVYVYPNPSTGAPPRVHIEVGVADQVRVRVYNTLGETVSDALLTDAPAVVDDGQGAQYAYEQTLDASLPSGVYTVSIVASKRDHDDLRARAKWAVVR